MPVLRLHSIHRQNLGCCLPPGRVWQLLRIARSRQTLRSFAAVLFLCGGLSLAVAESPETPESEPTENKAPPTEPAASEEPDATAQPASSEKKPPQAAEKRVLPPGLKPYRVLISLAFDHEPQFTSIYRHGVQSEIADLATKTLGEMWDLDITENDWLSSRSKTGIARLSAERLFDRFDTSEYDKVFLMTVETRGLEIQISGVEWDKATRELGRIKSTKTWQRREVADRLFSLTQELFLPLLVVDRVRENLVDLQLRAGGFPAVDPRADQLAPGDLVAPLFRYLDRDKNVKKVQGLPWTYLLVDSVDRHYVTAHIISGLRRPLGSRIRRRVELMAVKVRPETSGTDLKLVLRKNASRPLLGHQVDVLAKTFPKDEVTSEPLKLISNRRGIVHIPVDPGQPVVWLYLRSGKELLARMPYVPGTQPQETLQLLDDSMRLAVEGEIRLLKGRVVDAVAKRWTLILRARKFAENDKWTEADAELAELEKIPTVREFKRQLTAIRVPAIQAAQAEKNRPAENRINKLCRVASELIDKHLAEKVLRDHLDEINSFR